MNNPLVSVILDNYNYAEFLPEAIESVMNQTYKHFELILVDDGSTDNSKKIIEEYAKQDQRIIPIFKKNGGQASAFNKAFEISKGGLIAFLDSDDYWYNDKLNKIIEKHKKYKLVQHYLTRNGEGIYRKVDESVNWHKVLITYGYLYNHSVCSSLSFSREILESYFPLLDDHEMRICADGVLLMMALSETKIGFISEILGFYRVHNKNLFVDNVDTGNAARLILQKQHDYVNKQLQKCGKPIIPFDDCCYLIFLIKDLEKKNLINVNEHCIIYGTESSGLHMTTVLNQLGYHIVGYSDSDPKKWGTSFCNGVIYPPNDLDRLKFSKIIIASSASEAIEAKLIGLGMDLKTIRLPI